MQSCRPSPHLAPGRLKTPTREGSGRLRPPGPLTEAAVGAFQHREGNVDLVVVVVVLDQREVASRLERNIALPIELRTLIVVAGDFEEALEVGFRESLDAEAAVRIVLDVSEREQRECERL
jgi:ERCC4-type nuclease